MAIIVRNQAVRAGSQGRAFGAAAPGGRITAALHAAIAREEETPMVELNEDRTKHSAPRREAVGD
eukprot:4254454-Alexandrium_andersonii.AAC.1